MKKFRHYLMIVLIFLLLCSTNSISIKISNEVLENNKNVTFSFNDGNVWTKAYGGKSRDGCFSVKQTSDHGFILTGYYSEYGTHDFDLWLVKIDNFGNKEWDKVYGGEDWDYANDIQETIDGGYIITGKTRMYRYPEDIWLIKTDKDGNLEWDKAFDKGTYEYAFSVKQTQDGGYILVGNIFTWGFPVPYIATWLIKTDAQGKKIWEKIFGGKGDCGGKCIIQTKDLGYVFIGSTTFYGSGSRDIWLVKTDTNGIEQWNTTFGGVNYDIGYFVQQTSDGGFILVGETRSFGVEKGNVFLVRTDEFGNEIWSKMYGGSDYDVGHSVQQTSDGGFIIGGETRSFGSGYFDFYLIKTDEFGNELWNKTYGGCQYDQGWIVQQTSEGGYIFGGHTCSYGEGSDDMWLVKTDEYGCIDDGNNQPNKPTNPIGSRQCIVGFKYEYKTKTTDLDGDQVYYMFNWDDGTDSGWLGPYNSGEEISVIHIWNDIREYELAVKARDIYGKESEWSDFFDISTSREKSINSYILTILSSYI
jgi:hypothetical protein